MTFADFKKRKNGAYIRIAAEDIPGFSKKGMDLYGNCDDMLVIDWLYRPLDETYTVYLANPT